MSVIAVLTNLPDSAYAELERVIREMHPYELPEIIALPVERGLEAYLGWVAAECKPHPESAPDK